MIDGDLNEMNEQEGVRKVRLQWGSLDDLQTIYVNHIFISHQGPEFYLVFGELSLPIALDASELPESVNIIPKVRLAIAPEAMQAIARVISDNVHKYEENKG